MWTMYIQKAKTNLQNILKEFLQSLQNNKNNIREIHQP